MSPLHPYLVDNASVGPSDLALRAEALRAVATAQNVPLVDLFTRSGEVDSALEYSGTAQLFVDISHTTVLGAEVNAKLIMQELIDQNHPLAIFLNQQAFDDLIIPTE